MLFTYASGIVFYSLYLPLQKRNIRTLNRSGVVTFTTIIDIIFTMRIYALWGQSKIGMEYPLPNLEDEILLVLHYFLVLALCLVFVLGNPDPLFMI